MRLFGLIGHPLSHSFSKRYFTEKFDQEGIEDAKFELFPIENIEKLPDLIASHPDLKGLSVTIPHKQTVIPFLAELDETAAAVGAVNCILIDGTHWKGYNTDVIGLEQSLLSALAQHEIQPDYAYILGSGGASQAAVYVLNNLGIPFYIVSRHPVSENQISYAECHNQLQQRWPAEQAPEDTVLFINTTPLGTFPEVDKHPDIPFDYIHSKDLVFDLIYNPTETVLLREAKKNGAATLNGYEMLLLQAKAAWKIWTIKMQ